MADWRQIRARIRRAKAGSDATSRLEQLFDKTRDGMVAFELAQLEEAAGRIERAVDWYRRAWERFRRSEWKQKAEEALGRHGAPLPAPVPEERPGRHAAQEASAEAGPAEPAPWQSEPDAEPEAIPETEPDEPQEARSVPAVEAVSAAAAETPAPAEAPSGRRRRRRGGRGRRRSPGRKEGTEEAARPRSAPPAEPPPHAAARPAAPAPAARPAAPAPAARAHEDEPRPAAARHGQRETLPAIHIYRRGEPALASEIKALEGKLRQLLASHPYPLEELHEVPASPGVYLVSDSDLTTMYYLEACRNMRSGMDQFVSGRRGRQGSVRARLASYLGISDSQASRYMRQHCAVRWIEHEESDAVALGHFAAALLRPELMDETD